MIQAVLDVEISYVHISGEENIIADSLSRLHLNPYYYQRAVKASLYGYLVPTLPSTYMFNIVYPCLISRSGILVLATQCDGAPAYGTV